MLDPDLTEDDVRTAIGDLDAAVRSRAEEAWMALTAGTGPGTVTRAGLQNWLWWLLPKRSNSVDAYDEWVAMADAAAILFDQLHAHSYAALCRSERTAQVLAAWGTSNSQGRQASRRAMAASPVEPPDLDDFAWGTVFSGWENAARTAVEAALEAAIIDGRLDPSARSWRRVARQVCAEALDADHPSRVGQSWRTLVRTERAEQWAAGSRVPPTSVDARRQVAKRFLNPPSRPDPAAVAQPLALLTWFAVTCAEGVTLTASGYLPRALVAEAAERYGWWDWEKPPRSEADVWELRLVRKVAVALGVVRLRGRTLKTTKAGATLTDDPLPWWPKLVRVGLAPDPYRDEIFELLILALIDGRVHRIDRLASVIGDQLAAGGWQADGQPVSATDHGQNLYMAFNPWRVWGYITYRSARWESSPNGPRRVEPATVRISPAGTAAADVWLHDRITGPRHEP
ncbi:MAG: hypothetical protein ACK5PP_08755 [Acidimicrobiales bacterium]